MKTIKQIKEEYDNIVLDQLPEAPEDLVLEGREKDVKKSNRLIPSFSQMPTMLLFRRVAYRLYTNKQVVALYYSKLVDKYLSIPFGPDGNLNLSESQVFDTYEDYMLDEGAKWEAVKGALGTSAKRAVQMHVLGAGLAAGPGAALGTVGGAIGGAIEGGIKGYRKGKAKEMDKKLEETETWQRKEGQNPEGGLNRKGVEAYNRKHGAHLQTAVTTKPSKLKKGSKSANRRKSFCARMGGMKKRLTSAKTARDPDSRINKALRKWNCEEDFKLKLAQLREQRQPEQIDEFIGAALRATGRFAAGTAAGEAIYQGAKKGLKYISSKFKRGKKETPRDPSAMKKSSSSKVPVAADAADLLTKASQPGTDPTKKASNPFDDAVTKSKTDLLRDKTAPKSYSGFSKAKDSDEVFNTRYKQSLITKENKIVDIRNMIDEGTDNMSLQINGRTVTLNTSMAKRILEVYDSVNTKNKKIVESMLNEDLESFKKLLNFSIKV